MNTKTGIRLLAAAATMTVYIAFPPYRYWVMGSWMVYRIIEHTRMVKRNADQNQQRTA
jgi:hypothetical protein